VTFQIVHCRDQANWCEVLYRRKAPELLLYGRAMGLSHNEAEDVLQETFLTLLARKESPEQPEHYCVRTFRNRALNYRRSLWRRLCREWESRSWFEHTPGETEHERQAMKAMEGLPPEQREVLVLKIWHQHTFEEIADLLSLSANTVAGRYRYGLEKLRNRLKGAEYERDETNRSLVTFVDATPPVGEN
jgi:RNA polymerase sigma-70 factor (ECF subfamily)